MSDDEDWQGLRGENMAQPQYRLVTRSDFDGLVCAVLLREIGLINEILFVHPKDMQDGKIEITERDITTNVPYVATARLAFDHHSSEVIRNTSQVGNHVIDPNSPSAARVVWQYYGGREAFPNVSDQLMRAVDQADSAQYTVEEVLHPKDWTMLGFLMDARTGLGRFRNFRISNYQLMMALIDACRTLTVKEIMALPDVRERIDLYFEHEGKAVDQLLSASTVHGNIVVVDMRDQDRMWGLHKQNAVFAIGKSIFERTCATNIGDLCLRHGGGGHAAAGTCQVEHSMSDRVLSELLSSMQRDEALRLEAQRGA
jgi:nanoRNase/pAp phosphatase (c-di-AMP/oligoRNAs hydrolase)